MFIIVKNNEMTTSSSKGFGKIFNSDYFINRYKLHDLRTKWGRLISPKGDFCVSYKNNQEKKTVEIILLRMGKAWWHDIHGTL